MSGYYGLLYVDVSSFEQVVCCPIASYTAAVTATPSAARQMPNGDNCMQIASPKPDNHIIRHWRFIFSQTSLTLGNLICFNIATQYIVKSGIHSTSYQSTCTLKTYITWKDHLAFFYSIKANLQSKLLHLCSEQSVNLYRI